MPLKVKTSVSGTGTWKPVEQFLVKTSTAGTGIWKSIKSAFVKTDAGWKIFFGIAGPYTTKSPYFSTDTSGNTTVTGPTILYGSTIYGQRGTWVGNGGTISSYTYKLQGSTSSQVNTGTYTSILSETSMSGTYQQIVANTSQYDGKYLIFTVKATRSDGSVGSDSTDSNGTRFAVIRYAPVKKTFTDALLTTTSTSLPATLSYQSQWDGSTLYLPDSTRSSVKWYTASSNTYTAANIATYGTLVTSGITTGTPTNDGTTYTVTSTLVTPSSVPSGTYYYAVDSQFNSNTDYYNTTSGIQQYAVYGPMAFPPTPVGQSPSITGSTTVGNLAYFNIGSWTNSPTSYAWRIYYNYNLVSAVLTYAGTKSVSNKTLSGFSATLTTSTNHGYKANDDVIISEMDSLFNGTYKITSKTNNTISFTLSPTAYSTTSAYSVGNAISYGGNGYLCATSISSSSTFSITAAYSSNNSVDFNGLRYVAISSLPGSSAWNAGAAYSVGDNVYYNLNRYRANSSVSAASLYSSGTTYSSGTIVYSGNNRYQSNLNNNVGNALSNVIYWTNIGSYAPGINSMWTSVMPNNTSYWTNVDPGNSSYWTLQSFSNTSTSGTTTAPNYYEGTTTTADSFPLTIPTTDYKNGYDLRGQSLGIGVRAYNEIATSPSEYTAEKTVYGYPVITIGAITPSTTTASLAYTSSYMTSYTIDVKSSATISSITGGTLTVTYYAPNTFVSGQVVTITGVNPSQYNITGTIATATSSYFTISTNITGSYVSGGTATASAPTYPKTSYSPSSPISITNLQELTTYTVSIYPTNGEGQNGVTKTSSFTTYATPTISNISIVNTKAPSAATSPSFSSNSSNVGTLTWTNGANSSTAWLKSVTGAGTLSTQSDPGTLNTSGTFTINSSGTANATVSAINKTKAVYATWNQTKAASYSITYTISGFGQNTITGNSTASNPEVLLYSTTGTASSVTINSITIYHLDNQQGPSTTLSSSSSLTPTDVQTDTIFSGSVTYTIQPAYVPIFSSTYTINSDGWTGNISNYSASFTWNISTSAGSVAWNGSPNISTGNYQFIVTGLNPGQQATVTVTTTRSGYTDGSATQTLSAATGAALTPTFGTNTRTADGFSGSVSNYNSSYTFNFSVSGGATVTPGTISGTTYPFTVTGGTAGTSYTVTVTTTRTGYNNGSATTTASALNAALTPTFGTNAGTSDGFTGSVTNYDTSYTWGISASSGSVAWGVLNVFTRPFTVTGLQPSGTSTVTVTTSRTGYGNGSNTTTGTANALSAPTNTVLPTTTPSSGTVYSNGSVTVNTGTWTGSPTSYSYQWQFNAGPSGWQNCTGTGNATNSYTATVGDTYTGSTTLRCQVTATNAGGSNTVSTATLTITVTGTTSGSRTPTSSPWTYTWTNTGGNITNWFWAFTNSANVASATTTFTNGATTLPATFFAQGTGYTLYSQGTTSTITNSSATGRYFHVVAIVYDTKAAKYYAATRYVYGPT